LKGKMAHYYSEDLVVVDSIAQMMYWQDERVGF
jgi:hypothetical protein